MDRKAYQQGSIKLKRVHQCYIRFESVIVYICFSNSNYYAIFAMKKINSIHDEIPTTKIIIYHHQYQVVYNLQCFNHLWYTWNQVWHLAAGHLQMELSRYHLKNGSFFPPFENKFHSWTRSPFTLTKRYSDKKLFHWSS